MSVSTEPPETAASTVATTEPATQARAGRGDHDLEPGHRPARLRRPRRPRRRALAVAARPRPVDPAGRPPHVREQRLVAAHLDAARRRHLGADHGPPRRHVRQAPDAPRRARRPDARLAAHGRDRQHRPAHRRSRDPGHGRRRDPARDQPAHDDDAQGARRVVRRPRQRDARRRWRARTAPGRLRRRALLLPRPLLDHLVRGPRRPRRHPPDGPRGAGPQRWPGRHRRCRAHGRRAPDAPAAADAERRVGLVRPPRLVAARCVRRALRGLRLEPDPHPRAARRPQRRCAGARSC